MCDKVSKFDSAKDIPKSPRGSTLPIDMEKQLAAPWGAGSELPQIIQFHYREPD